MTDDGCFCGAHGDPNAASLLIGGCPCMRPATPEPTAPEPHCPTCRCSAPCGSTILRFMGKTGAGVLQVTDLPCDLRGPHDVHEAAVHGERFH